MNIQNFYYFLMLRRAYREIENGTKIPITITQLSKLLFCTERNVKNILMKLVEEKLLTFTSGKGRGNTSTISFLEGYETFLSQQTKEMISKNEINRALDLIKEFGHGTKVKELVIEWIRQYFGYHYYEAHESIRFPIFRPITTIDPTEVFFDLDAHISMQIHDTLVTYDIHTNTYSGSLAHSWECNDSKTNWVFYLRKGVTFHNGALLNANDVRSSFFRLRTSPHKWLMDDVEDIVVLSDYKIEFILKRPNFLFLQYASYAPAGITGIETSIGTGPFCIQYIDENRIELKVFDAYFGYRPQLDLIEIIRLPDDILENFEEWKEVYVDAGEHSRGVTSKLHEKRKITSGTTVLTLNLVKNGPLQDIKVRKWLQSIIDRTIFTQEDGVPLRPAISFVNQSYQNSKQVESINTNFSLTLITYKRHKEDAILLAEQFRWFGVQLLVRVVDWDEMDSIDIKQEADMVLFEGTPHEGEISLFDLLLCEKGFIFPFLTEDIKEIIETTVIKMKREEKEENRIDLYLKLEQFLASCGLIIFLVHKEIEVSYHTTLDGVAFNSRMWIDFKKLWYKHV